MKRLFKKKIIPGAFLGLLLALFTLYVALDTFVIPRSYTTAGGISAAGSVQAGNTSKTGSVQAGNTSNTGSAQTGNSNNTGSAQADKQAGSTGSVQAADTDTSNVNEQSDSAELLNEIIQTDSSYSDGNLNIELETYYEYGTYIYVADVEASEIGYLKAAFAQDTYGKNITDTTSEIATDNNAILAINGDYYGSQEKGYVIRNGVLYRSTAKSGQEDLVIYSDGTFEIINEDDITAEELLEKGAWQVFSFGPGIVSEGEIAVTEDEEVGKAKASNPRTAIGFIDDSHYVLVVSDGRTDESEGLSLYELAEFMQSLGVVEAYNLDGGGSSTMYFNGEVINNPTSTGNSIKERNVSDIIYFAV